MPAIKDAVTTHAVSDVLSRSEVLANHPALKKKMDNEQYATIIQEVAEELRTLQARLVAHDDVNKSELNKWCADASTQKRLNNISSTLDALQKVDDDMNAHHKHLTSSDLRHRMILNHCMQNLRLGARYDKPFIEYLKIGPFLKQQRVTAERMKKLETAKDFASSVVDVGGKAKKVVSTAKMLSLTADHAARGAEGVSETMHIATGATPVAASVLQAIPIVGAAMTAAKAAYDLGHSFLKKKGASDKVANGVMLVLSGAALALTIAFPVAAAGIAAGMVAASAVKDHIKPYIELRKEIKERENDVIRLGERNNEIDHPPVVLNDAEKKMLAGKIENYFIENKSLSTAELKAAKEAIWQGDMSKINNDPFIKNAFNLSPDLTAEKYLQQQNVSMQGDIKIEIAGLTKKKNEKLAQSINDGFTVAGAVMLAIPIPPVMIAGAALLLASSVAGIIIKYRDQIANGFNKLKDGVKHLFGVKSTNEPVTEEPKPEPPKVTHVVAKTPQAISTAPEPAKQQVAVSVESQTEEVNASSRRRGM